MQEELDGAVRNKVVFKISRRSCKIKGITETGNNVGQKSKAVKDHNEEEKDV